VRLLLLIPSSSYRTEAYVEAARRLGIELTVASEQDSTFSAADNPGLLTLDFADPVEASEVVAHFAEEHAIAAVIGVDDATAVAAARIAQALGLPHNSPEAVAGAGDKYLQRERLGKAGVQIPQFRRVAVDQDGAGLATTLEFPVVLKPIHLSASRGVMRADSEQEFLRCRDRLIAILSEPDVCDQGGAGHFLIEGYVNGPEYALEGLLVNGVFHELALFDKPDPLNGPFFEETIYTTPSRVGTEIHKELGTSIVLVTHDEALARLAHETVVLRDGQLVADQARRLHHPRQRKGVSG